MFTIKKLFIAVSLLLCIPFCVAADATPSEVKVYISQVVEHSALNATSKGIQAGLEANGFKPGVNLDLRLESAQASTALAAQIASKYTNQQPNIVVGVGTLSALSFAKYAQQNNVKLVFSSVTDPLGAGLVKSLQKPGNNTTGVSNFVDLAPQLALIKKIQPQLHTLGFIYNAGESNSVFIAKKLQKICSKSGINLITQSVSKTSEVPQAAAKLANQVGAIFISNDNTVLSAIQSVILNANNAGIPVYVSDTDAVQLGALAALGPNQYEVGVQTGIMIARILQGSDLNTMPVQFPVKADLYLNMDAAKITNINIPADLLARAAVIVEKQP